MNFFSPFLRRVLIVFFVCVFLSVSTFTGEAVADTSTEVATVCPETIPRDPRIRYSATSCEGKENLKSFQKALKIMREMKCKDPRSWYYQSAIHWVPTTPENTSGIQEENPLCPFYSKFGAFFKPREEPESDTCTITPKEEKSEERFFGRIALSDLAVNPAALKLRASWDSCTHKENHTGMKPVIHFLPWHRLYLYHFEKIVRKLSGDPNFSLPYWDYISYYDTKLPDQQRLTMPTEFYTPSQEYEKDPTTGNSLYESGRDPELNRGEPMSYKDASKDLFNPLEDLHKAKLFSLFSLRLEDSIHGFIHVYVGGGFMKEDRDKCGNCIIFNRIFNRRNFDDKKTDKYGNVTIETTENKCQLGLMRKIPSAGFDPIFWLHHANIDRLWEQWNNDILPPPTGWKQPFPKLYEISEQLPKLWKHVQPKQLERVSWPYQFFEPDGEVISYSMKEVVENVYNMDYKYDDYDTYGYVPRHDLLRSWITRWRNLTFSEKQEAQELLEQKKYQELFELLNPKQFLGINDNRATVKGKKEEGKEAGEFTNLRVEVEPEFGDQLKSNQSGQLESNESDQPNYMLDVNVRYQEVPEGIYRVYLNLPEDKEARETAIDLEEYFVGTISFFTLDRDRPTLKIFDFDITDEILSQYQNKELDINSVSISIRNEGKSVNEDLNIESIEIYSMK